MIRQVSFRIARDTLGQERLTPLLECEDHQRKIVIELPRGRSRLIDYAVQPLGLGHILERLLRE